MRGASAALAPRWLLCRRPRRGAGRDAARRARAGLPGRAAARGRAHVCRAHAARARRGGARRLARPQARPARLPGGRGPDARARAGRVPRGGGDHRARRAALAGAVGGRAAARARRAGGRARRRDRGPGRRRARPLRARARGARGARRRGCDARREPRAGAARLPLGGARRRGSALLPPSGRGPGRHRARAGGRSARAPRGAGCQHADAAAGEERLPLAAAHALPQAPGGGARPAARGAGEQGGDPRALRRLGVPGGRRRPPRPRFQRGGPGLLREAARRARAGRVRATGGHHPLAERSLAAPPPARRARVLEVMVQDGLDKSVGAEAMATPLKLAPPRARPVAALYVAAEVARELPRLLPRAVAEAPGLSVFTSIDADAQREAERATRHGVAALERGRRRRAPLQAALVALDPNTGRVRALVGGRDYGSSPLDRAVRSRRQPGSAFKPFVYVAALDPARRGAAPPRTVVSLVEDTPLSVRVGARVWQPVNYDGTFAGTIPLEDAIAESRNAATVRVALDVGLDAVARAAADLGIASPLPRVPALALGVAETTLLELTAAYGVFASGGVRRPPTLVVAVASADGETLYAAPPEEEHVIDPGVAYLVTHLLEGVVDRGTGRPAREAGLTGSAAGKTGTTDDTRDAWFVGFTPEVVAGVWVGLDGGGPTGLTGAQGALPIWTDFVRATSGEASEQDFPVPDDIVWREVDPASGELATAGCPESRHEPFLAGTEPTEPCRLHREVWTAVGEEIGGAVRGGGRAIGSTGRRLSDWFRRLFR